MLSDDNRSPVKVVIAATTLLCHIKINGRLSIGIPDRLMVDLYQAASAPEEEEEEDPPDIFDIDYVTPFIWDFFQSQPAENWPYGPSAGSPTDEDADSAILAELVAQHLVWTGEGGGWRFNHPMTKEGTRSWQRSVAAGIVQWMSDTGKTFEDLRGLIGSSKK